MRSLRTNSTTLDFLRHGGVVFLSSVVVNLAAFAFHVDYSRALGPRGYGALYSVINITSFVSVIAGIFTVIVSKIVADAVAAHQEIGGIAAALIRRGIVIGVVFGGLMCVLSQPIARFLNVDIVTLLFLAFFSSTQACLGSARGVVQGAQLFTPLAWSLAIEGVLRTVAAIALVHVFPAVPTAVACYALGSVIAMTYVILVVRARYGAQSMAALDYGGLLRTASGIAASSVSIAVLTTADVVFVRHFFSNYESGIYGAVALVGKTILFAVSFLPMILLPKASQSASHGGSKHLLFSAAALVSAVSIVALGAFAVFPNAIIHIVAGAGYDAAVHYILPYGMAMAALGAANGFVAYRIGAGDFSFVTPLMALAVAECAAIIIWHGTLAEVVAIVIAVSVASLIASLYGIRRSSRKTLTPTQVILLREELEV